MGDGALHAAKINPITVVVTISQVYLLTVVLLLDVVEIACYRVKCRAIERKHPGDQNSWQP